MRAGRWTAVGVGIPVLICGGLVVVVKKPFWDQEAELKRIFTHSAIRMKLARNGRHGDLTCLGSCPSTRALLDAGPNTYQNFVDAVMPILISHGYTMEQHSPPVDNGGRMAAAPIECFAPGGASSRDTWWLCVYSARGPRFNLRGMLGASPSTLPDPTYKSDRDLIADHLPSQTILSQADISISRNQ
ncbi:hypothetical protein [Actinoplanes sp. L3-i22]|uniref:hypothetical protein n=1 Tax=Actinoplanes sp. L3-i22 TaxID=2836373 RepID=UPI001C742B06|nr:hypothetical protein [Actinoplanes sp. L3-i22]BCY09898.1 hypothetical protein L3i22_049860 [Actinoplanes sp. L3-i22]